MLASSPTEPLNLIGYVVVNRFSLHLVLSSLGQRGRSPKGKPSAKMQVNTEGKDITVTAYDRWTKIEGQLVGYEAREMEVAAGVFGVLGRLGYFETEKDRVGGKSSNFQFYITADGARCLAAMLLEKANESDSASQNPVNLA